jgi:outer membrane biosynthesis protein TonB
MKMIHKTDRLALALLLCAVPGFAQPEQTPKNEAPPDLSAPQTQDSQTSKPASPPQSSAPSPPQDQQSAPKENSPAPVKETPPTTKPHSETHKSAVSTKTGSTSKKRRKKQAAGSSKSVVHQSAAGDPAGQNGKVVVRNGGAADGLIQLSPGGSQEQEIHNRENTAQLLATTDQNLKRISTRQLTTSEQSTLDQIQAFVRQARSASDAGDLTRAHTLAFKAHLLSDDLAKR